VPLVVGLEQTGQSQVTGGVVKLLHARLWQAGDGAVPVAMSNVVFVRFCTHSPPGYPLGVV